MDLKDFIVAAITDISGGIADADEAIREAGGMVNPGTHQSIGSEKKEFIAPRTKLNFDIAVSASTKAQGGAGAKAKIWVVEASIGGEKEALSESVSRLTFSLDVAFPSDREQEARLGKVSRPAK